MLRVFRQYYPVRNILFVITESVFIFLSIFTAIMLFDSERNPPPGMQFLYKALIITVVCQLCIYYNDLYDMKSSLSPKEIWKQLFKALFIANVVLGVMFFTIPWLSISPEIFFTGFILMLLMIGLIRLGYNLILERGYFNRRLMLIGESDLAREIADEIQLRADSGYKISCIVLDRANKDFMIDADTRVIQKTDYSRLFEIAKEMGIKTIVVAIKEKRGNFPSEELLKCRIEGLKILDGDSFYEMLSGKLVVNQLYPSWLIFSDGFQKTLIRRIFKRTFDIVLSLLMTIVLMPLMLLVALIIKIDSKGPVFYSQDRVGQNHKNYKIYKFRSMIDNAEETNGPQFACENDPRITRVGHFLRKLRIDEMPQLWNVLKGEMSFVGPRPERDVFVRDYEKEIPYYRERFSIKPGITGWAQIRYQYGANTEETIEKLNYDLFYIKNMSILMDIIIVLRTIKIVLFGTGAR